jgi:hypothetical protein
MKILMAFEDRAADEIVAVVELDTKQTQTVRVPSWASRQNILDEAARVVSRDARRATAQVQRADLEG